MQSVGEASGQKHSGMSRVVHKSNLEVLLKSVRKRSRSRPQTASLCRVLKTGSQITAGLQHEEVMEQSDGSPAE